MAGESLSFFEGLSAEERARILRGLKRHRFSAGATVIAEGDERHEIYVIQSGTAEVYLADHLGIEHTVSRVGAGATLGEISFFTGVPASATVRATADLEVLVLDEADFAGLTAAFPRILYNVGAILSQRLARTTRRLVRTSSRHILLLVDHGAPPLLSYALACSVAWHTRRSALLLVLADELPAPELAAFAAAPRLPQAEAEADGRAPVAGAVLSGARASLQFGQPAGPFSPANLPGTATGVSKI